MAADGRRFTTCDAVQRIGVEGIATRRVTTPGRTTSKRKVVTARAPTIEPERNRELLQLAYERLEGQTGPAYRGVQISTLFPMPFVGVEVTLGDQTLPCAALIDSGADRTLVPFEVAVAFGIDATSLPVVSYHAGEIGLAEQRVAAGSVTYRGVAVCPEQVLISAEGSLPFPWVILGREDFFRLFAVAFRWDATPPAFTVRPAARGRQPSRAGAPVPTASRRPAGSIRPARPRVRKG
ncbi:MAG: hypothetical protein ACR2KI_01965 [Candidatus Limnocylindria bacterium]